MFFGIPQKTAATLREIAAVSEAGREQRLKMFIDYSAVANSDGSDRSALCTEGIAEAAGLVPV